MASASTTSGTAGTSGTGEWAWWPLKVAGTPWNISDTMTAWGMWAQYDPNDPLTAVYAQICKAANPGGSYITGTNKYGYGHATPTPLGLVGQNGTTNGAWEIFCEMCLRVNGVLFCESVIGDCGAAIPVSNSDVAVELGTQAAEAVGSLVPIPGLGAAIGDLGGLLSGAAHAQAVSTEKQTLCSLAAQYTQEIQNAYRGFVAGQLSAQGCVTYIQGLASDFKQDVEKIVKSCNASCGMIGVMNAHAMIAPYRVGLTAVPGFVGTAQPTAEGLIGSDIIVGGSTSQIGTATAPSIASAALTAASTATGISPTLIIVLLIAAVILLLVI